MEHFSEPRWADFVRGISAPEFSRDIRAHLNAGCPKCKTAHHAWSRVQRFTTNEGAYEPADNVVRLATLGFVSKHAPRPQKWILAHPVFDSFNQPLLAGVRGALNVWQVIYEGEGLTVDLRLGRREPSKTVHLVGQVLDRAAARALQTDASIELSTEQEYLVAVTAPSALGEFHFEFEAKDQMWLSVKAEGRNAIRIPLTSAK